LIYLVATPIGNLADFSIRAVETLQHCDYILCEDTRHSQTLLNHYGIKKPLKSFHAFNESKAIDSILIDLQNGRNIALISDAGTPLFADPGFELVKRCRESGIPLTSIPGSNAALTALILSGFPLSPFQFVGFLPKKTSELSSQLIEIFLYRGTTICYETPHRLVETLSLIKKIAPSRLLCVARELTKRHEECLNGSAEELYAHFSEHDPRGECVLLFAPPYSLPLFEEFSHKELVAYLCQEFALSKQDAIKLAAELHRVPKKKVYNETHDIISTSCRGLLKTEEIKVEK
jgi:16S rRNA (cytidine1402-2'-O)-methyltransferase